MTPILQIENLSTTFATREGVVHAVNGIDLCLESGETLAIVGESGCGKSVSMLSVMRLVPDPPGRITADRISFQKQDLLRASEEQMRQIRGHQLAMVFQDPVASMNPVLTVGRQLAEGMELHLNLTRAQARQRGAELLEMVHLPDAALRLDDYPHLFSGGMLQRVMIAMAISCGPKILIADEPTTALDVTIQAQIIDMIKEVRDRMGMSIIWITHDLGIVAGLADRVMVMHAGFVVEEASVHELYRTPLHPYTHGLLASLPRLDEGRRERLLPIEGMPPDPMALPKGCAFYARCHHRQQRCLTERPELRTVATDHRIACWADIRDQEADR